MDYVESGETILMDEKIQILAKTITDVLKKGEKLEEMHKNYTNRARCIHEEVENGLKPLLKQTTQINQLEKELIETNMEKLKHAIPDNSGDVTDEIQALEEELKQTERSLKQVNKNIRLYEEIFGTK